MMSGTAKATAGATALATTRTAAAAWALLLLCALVYGAPEGSGAPANMGQSMSGIAIPWTGCAGAYTDEQGRLWTVAGDRAYCFKTAPGETWQIDDDGIVPLPTGMRAMKGFEGRLVCQDHEGSIWDLDLRTRKTRLLAKTQFADGKPPRDFAISRDGVFALGEDGTIKSWSDDGTPGGVLFTLTKPEKADWWYCALGIEPVSGDLLVGSYWPDSKVYRFTPKGKPVTEDWPKEIQCQGIYMAAGAPWGLTPGGDGRALQSVARGIPSAVQGTSWTGYPTGVTVSTGAQMWIACAQGLVGLNRKGRPTGKRIGGLGDPGIVAAGPDGTVLTLVENSQRFVRMSADDTPGTAFASNANEPWRVANGWGGRAVGCAWDGKGYLTLDAGGSKALWRFDPDHTAFAETPWTRIGKEQAFVDPRGLAVGDACCWVLDGASLLEFGPGDWNAAPKTVTLPADIDAKVVVALCAAGDDRLYLATKTQAAALDRDGGGWKIVWQSLERFEDIAGICAAPSQVIVADRGMAPGIAALEPRDGRLQRRIISAEQARDFEPRGVAYAAGYVFVSDAKGHRVLRVTAGG